MKMTTRKNLSRGFPMWPFVRVDIDVGSTAYPEVDTGTVGISDDWWI